MKNLFRLLSFGKPYWVVIIVSFISSILYGIFNAASLWVVGSLIGTIFGVSARSQPQDMSSLNTKIGSNLSSRHSRSFDKINFHN